MRITVAGSGYVGLVTGACLADTGNRVLGYDINRARVDELNAGKCPIFEPGLADLLQQNRDAERIRFTHDLDEAVRHAEIVFIAIGTPPLESGAADLSSIESFARELGPRVGRPLVVAIKSTVPVGTGERVETLIRERTKFPVDVVSNPEFLKEGGAVRDFQFPDRVVVGSQSPEAARVIEDLYRPFVRNQKPMLRMSRRAAELTKYAANAYLAMRVSFINEIANLCDRLDVDVDEVRRGMGSDARIGHHFLYPGAGYGGSCFPKDVRALAHLAEESGMAPRLLPAIHDVNVRQKRVLFEKFSARFGGQVRGLTAALWGAAFKPNTDDIREAAALALIDQLLDAGTRVRVHDPKALAPLRQVYKDRVTYCPKPYEALDEADVLFICTEWNEFRSPDFDEIARRLRKRVVLDGRNLYEGATLRRYGLEYYPVGRPAVRERDLSE
ncbi:MAG: UDP-glucose 6-dehydrogenase [Phycisphaerae bacterium]|nr:UDP-glucose 6-dehydrogenase [Phycisphaerae bacterium]